MIETEPVSAVQDAGTNQVEVIAFCCNFCAYAAADLAAPTYAVSGERPHRPRALHRQSRGAADPGRIRARIDGVLLAGCLEGGCHFVEGTCERSGAWRRRSRSSTRSGLGATGCGW